MHVAKKNMRNSNIVLISILILTNVSVYSESSDFYAYEYFIIHPNATVDRNVKKYVTHLMIGKILWLCQKSYDRVSYRVY